MKVWADLMDQYNFQFLLGCFRAIDLVSKLIIEGFQFLLGCFEENDPIKPSLPMLLSIPFRMFPKLHDLLYAKLLHFQFLLGCFLVTSIACFTISTMLFQFLLGCFENSGNCIECVWTAFNSF